jgi:uncharacterized membrane protein
VLSAVKPIDTVRGLEINALGDGLFHLGSYSFISSRPCITFEEITSAA